jgi:integrase
MAAALAKVLPWRAVVGRSSLVVREPAAFRLTPPEPPMPKKPPRRRKPPVSLSDEQFLALLQTAKDHRLRDWILILFTYRHGFRASEPLGVTAADFDMREGKVFVRRGKGSEGGWQDLMSWPDNPLLDERAAIEYWLANREQFGVKGAAKKGARKRASVHGLRGSVRGGLPGGAIPAGADDQPSVAPSEIELGKPGARVRKNLQPGKGGQDGRDSGGRSDRRESGSHCRAADRPDGEELSGRGTLVKMQQSTKIVAFSPNSLPDHEGNASEDEDLEAPVEGGRPSRSELAPGAKPAGAFSPPSASQRELLAPSAPPDAPSERLFPISRGQFWRLVHKYALAAGIPPRKCKTHMLKHTIAKHLVRAGHPVNEIMEWMGWRSMETMMWYIRPDEEELGQRIGDRIRGMQGLRAARQGSLFP